MRFKLDIARSSPIVRSGRVMQVEGLFDVPPARQSEVVWHHDVDLGEDWTIGAIVGPSGCGKTTFARAAFGEGRVKPSSAAWDWPGQRSILDAFPVGMGIGEITGLLCAVGFSSPPAWLRPFGVLSNGEQFRVNLARTLAECPDLAVVDEFSSVVDRTAARIGSAALAKAIRGNPASPRRRFVAVTCHYDVLAWLEPDWVYEPHTGKLIRGRLCCGRIWRRPPVELVIRRVHRNAWELFRPHHYLSGRLHHSAQCFVAFVENRPAAFVAVLQFPHPISPGWREHRCVCLPEFQGIGIGNALSGYVASLYAQDRPYRSTTSHPGMIRHRRGSDDWQVARESSLRDAHQGLGRRGSFGRLTTSFRYIGPCRPDEAAAFGLRVGKSLVATEK